MDIKDLPDDVLLEAAAARGLPVGNLVDLWIKQAQIHPGQTRTSSTYLWTKYLEWQATQQTGQEPLPRATWGEIMAMRFKRGRSNKGYFYYISKESDRELEGI